MLQNDFLQLPWGKIWGPKIGSPKVKFALLKSRSKMKESTCSGKRPVCVGDIKSKSSVFVGDIKFDKDRVARNGGAQLGMILSIDRLPSTPETQAAAIDSRKWNIANVNFCSNSNKMGTPVIIWWGLPWTPGNGSEFQHKLFSYGSKGSPFLREFHLNSTSIIKGIP